MEHPIKGKVLLVYILVWVFIIIVHSVILFNLLNVDIMLCLADAVVFYVLLSGFGMSYYFVVAYLSKSGKITPQEIITHLAGVSFMVCLITMAHGTLMRNVINNSAYLEFLQYSSSWRLASGVLIILILVLIYYLYTHNQYIRKQEQKAADLKNLLKESEMEMLKFQINPHFIFNSLNSISALTMTAPEQAQEMVIRLSQFFRNALGKEKRDLHSVAEEVEQMDLYLQMEQVRFGERLEIELNVPEDCLERKLPALILQPLYENAIKHGVYEHLEKVKIETHITCSEGMLEIAIANTFDPGHRSSKGTGIGLKNVRSRLELMYGIPDLVTIERTKNTYRVKILIPQTYDQGNHH
ncbi:MAG: histidine kinase [Cyclobacteriaceae bacterium]